MPKDQTPRPDVLRQQITNELENFYRFGSDDDKDIEVAADKLEQIIRTSHRSVAEIVAALDKGIYIDPAKSKAEIASEVRETVRKALRLDEADK